ncbi:MAG: DUF3108 domain-containing protein [Alphaproteobacteria bacterium]|jgi:hypothetical protein|nr:DUF3108 domain-containing protein [Alphaproteobacteria bacterium]
MKRSFLVRVSAAVVANILLAGVTAAQSEPDKQAMTVSSGGLGGFSLTYDVYKGGFRALQLDFFVGITGDETHTRYDTKVKMETAGLVGALFNWRFDAISKGTWRKGEIVPERYHTANVWRGNEREVTINYKDGVASKVSAEPPYSEEDMKKVSPSMIPGAVDPTSAVTALVLNSALHGRCKPETPIYDGRRRYDANMSVLEPRKLKPSNFAPFAGLAEGCRMTFKRIAGFKPDKKRLQNLEVDVWSAEVGLAPGRVPVRLELVTPWGKGFAHLVRAQNAEGALVFGEPAID